MSASLPWQVLLAILKARLQPEVARQMRDREHFAEARGRLSTAAGRFEVLGETVKGMEHVVPRFV